MAPASRTDFADALAFDQITGTPRPRSRTEPRFRGIAARPHRASARTPVRATTPGLRLMKQHIAPISRIVDSGSPIAEIHTTDSMFAGIRPKIAARQQCDGVVAGEQLRQPEA